MSRVEWRENATICSSAVATHSRTASAGPMLALLACCASVNTCTPMPPPLLLHVRTSLNNESSLCHASSDKPKIKVLYHFEHISCVSLTAQPRDCRTPLLYHSLPSSAVAQPASSVFEQQLLRHQPHRMHQAARTRRLYPGTKELPH